MAGLHRTYSSARTSVAEFLENPTPEAAERVRSMMARTASWQAVLPSLSASERQRLAELLASPLAEAA